MRCAVTVVTFICLLTHAHSAASSTTSSSTPLHRTSKSLTVRARANELLRSKPPKWYLRMLLFWLTARTPSYSIWHDQWSAARSSANKVVTSKSNSIGAAIARRRQRGLQVQSIVGIGYTPRIVALAVCAPCASATAAARTAYFCCTHCLLLLCKPYHRHRRLVCARCLRLACAAQGLMLRSLHLSTALPEVWNPSIGLGAGACLAARWAQREWLACLMVGWYSGGAYWRALGVDPPPDFGGVPVTVRRVRV